MSEADPELIPVFVPSLAATLVNREDTKGEPLTYEEVIRIRDCAPCIMMQLSVARKLDEGRGYRDIDPENCWHEWQQLRREMGRKPDLDPGPVFTPIDSNDAEYQETIQQARASLEQFRQMLPADGSSYWRAMVKTAIYKDGYRAFWWLDDVQRSGSDFIGKFSEVPVGWNEYAVGQQITVAEDKLVDWMFVENGVAHGGFSLRLQRSTLPPDEWESFDEYVGVTEWASG